MSVLLVGSASGLGEAIPGRLTSGARVLRSSRGSESDLKVDLDDLSGIRRIPPGIDTVVLVAALTPDRSLPMSRFIKTNVLGTIQLAELCFISGVERLVFVSSISASYGPEHPRYDSYGCSKRMAEDVLGAFRHSMDQDEGSPSMHIISLRFGILWGSERLNRRSSLISGLVRHIDRGEPVIFPGSRDSQRSFTHVDDAVDAIILACTDDMQGVFTCTDPNPLSLTELASCLAHSMGRPHPHVRFSGSGQSIPDAVPIPDGTLSLSDVSAWLAHRTLHNSGSDALRGLHAPLGGID